MAIWHNTALFRIGVAVAAVLVITAACGSNATETAEQLGVDDLATEAEATAESQDGTVVIQTEVTFGDQAGSSTGEWTAVEGADVLGCSTGSLIERETEGGVAAELSCTDGQKDGTFIGLFSPSGAGPTFSSNWDLLVADGEFADMSGTGTWTGEVSPGDAPSVSTIELDVEFGKFATPLTSFDRLVQWTETDCWDGFVTDDGLFEFGTVDDILYELDLLTGETREAGEAPAGCAWWIGDRDLGRRVAISLPGGPHALPGGQQTVFFGSYDGDWESEVTYDETTLIINRSIADNRVVLSHPNSGRVFMLDATTGDPIGSSIEGSFPGGRHTVAVAFSPDGRFVALGGANVQTQAGQLFILDAATGEQISRIELTLPVAALTFDQDSTEVYAGSVSGDITTVAIDGEVVSTLDTGSSAITQSLGVRSDGLIVVATDSGAFLVDPELGTAGNEIAVKHSGASRVQPDGKITSLTNVQVFEVYEIEG